MSIHKSGDWLRVMVSGALLLCFNLPANGQTLNRSDPPPLGHLVDLGGYRVHSYCTGQGSPTVFIVGAAFSFDWALVQSQVAKFARVCTFDPSGTAWSDPFPSSISLSKTSNRSSTADTPSCADRVDEIHRLFTKIPINGPYMLVGFSVGALWERIYAAQYPGNLAGMIIIDHAFLGEDGERAPPRTATTTDGLGYTPPVLISKTPIFIGFEDDSNFGKLPEQDQQLHAWAMSRHPLRPNYELAVDCFSLIYKLTKTQDDRLGSTPLVVISTRNETQGYQELQQRLMALSTKSEHIVATNSSHMVPIDAPEVIVRAIHEVVNDAR